MFKFLLVASLITVYVHSAPSPQSSDDVEVGDGNNRISGAEFDYK